MMVVGEENVGGELTFCCRPSGKFESCLTSVGVKKSYEYLLCVLPASAAATVLVMPRNVRKALKAEGPDWSRIEFLCQTIK